MDAGWVAGLIEGEGCFHVAKDGGVMVTVSMADRDVIARLCDSSGLGQLGGPYQAKRPGRDRKPMWRWTVTNRRHLIVLVKAVYPHLGSRRRREAEALVRVLLRGAVSMRKRPCEGCGGLYRPASLNGAAAKRFCTRPCYHRTRRRWARVQREERLAS